MSFTRRAAVAVHEAGHAVIGARSGIEVTFVTVDPGRCHWGRTGTGVAHGKAGLAGALAAMRLADLLGGSLDWSVELSAADWANVGSSFTAEERQALLAVTREEVRVQWPWIMPTAMALYLRMSVDGRELQSILDGPGDTSSPTWFERQCRGLLGFNGERR